MNSKFYENDFMSTRIKEIEFIRSPYYDIAKEKYMNNEEVHDMLDDLGLKLGMIDIYNQLMVAP
jgi:hypothetical protein